MHINDTANLLEATENVSKDVSISDAETKRASLALHFSHKPLTGEEAPMVFHVTIDDEPADGARIGIGDGVCARP